VFPGGLFITTDDYANQISIDANVGIQTVTAGGGSWEADSDGSFQRMDGVSGDYFQVRVNGSTDLAVKAAGDANVVLEASNVDASTKCFFDIDRDATVFAGNLGSFVRVSTLDTTDNGCAMDMHVEDGLLNQFQRHGWPPGGHYDRCVQLRHHPRHSDVVERYRLGRRDGHGGVTYPRFSG
jgi:ABC-type uncharacterized transport system involved in gliding motility auxiliary subunit